MNDHNLDDLIIDNISPKNSKTKSFLTLIALAIVVLIIAIILTKIILKDPQSQSSNIDENSVYISPDLTLESMDDTEKEIVKAPHIPTTEEIKPEIAMPETTTSINKTNTMKDTHQVNNATTEAEKRKQLEAEAQEAQRKIERKEAKEAQRQIELTAAREEKAKEQALAEEKEKEKEKEKREQKETSKLAEEKAKEPVTQTKAHPYFIQVGSFSKAPSTRFLTVITRSGFHYQITTSENSGNKKLLIGPYDTKATADKALKKVKDRINKSAFIIRK